MLFREIIAVYFENRKTQVHSLGKAQSYLTVKPSGVYSYHCASAPEAEINRNEW
jgi:hypothetical protein